VVALALWPWMMFYEGLTRAMAAVPANGGLIRKVAFPHRLLVYAAVAGTFLIHSTGFLAVILALKAFGEPVELSGIPAAFLLLVPMFLLTVGIGALLAALQTLLKDVEQVVGILITILFYVTPVLYPVALVPESLRPWVAANPLGMLFERIRDVMLQGGFLVAADFWLFASAALVAVAGLAFFNRLSPFFEDFL
jgi:ABC-type polysaccharide/polyol phosphate export permease